ncbi:MAG: hypothetical protein LBS82_01405 [Spirochaetaceae bacterium]|nr:hypothetical protein [Spirochaetaceae bacterium]
MSDRLPALALAGALLLASALGGCRPELDLLPLAQTNADEGTTYATASDSYGDIFAAFWQGMSENYLYWDAEPAGYWDAVWRAYKPRFDALGPYPANAEAARQHIADMVAPLCDGHLHISFESGLSLSSVSPSADRIEKRFTDNPGRDNPKETFYRNNWSGTPSALNASNWNYWEGCIRPGYIIDEGLRAGADSLHIALGKIDDDGGGDGYIAYLSFNEFTITENLGSNPSGFIGTYLSRVTDAQCMGVIFDLRGNTGGYNADIPLLLSPLLAGDLHFAWTRTKKGVNRLDYAPTLPYVVRANPAGAHRAANAGRMPLAALVDDYTISCAELLSLAIRATGGRLIGTTTWGAVGLRVGDASPVITHGGSFTHNKLWTGVVQAGLQAQGLNGEVFEGVGLEPDERIEFNLSAFASGTDAQLEAAIAYVRGLTAGG